MAAAPLTITLSITIKDTGGRWFREDHFFLAPLHEEVKEFFPETTQCISLCLSLASLGNTLSIRKGICSAHPLPLIQCPHPKTEKRKKAQRLWEKIMKRGGIGVPKSESLW